LKKFVGFSSRVIFGLLFGLMVAAPHWQAAPVQAQEAQALAGHY
jgi:hypothetical protein